VFVAIYTNGFLVRFLVLAPRHEPCGPDPQHEGAARQSRIRIRAFGPGPTAMVSVMRFEDAAVNGRNAQIEAIFRAWRRGQIGPSRSFLTDAMDTATA